MTGKEPLARRPMVDDDHRFAVSTPALQNSVGERRALAR